jgi:hypothetical protein
MQRLKKLNTIQQRKAAALLGALVGDAAGQCIALTQFVSNRSKHYTYITFLSKHAVAPLHWIYDQEKVAKLIKERAGEAEFFPKSQCPFYIIESGSNTTYGDQLYVTLKSIADNKG